MSFENKINDEIKNAMKGGDKARLETLRSIRAAIIEFVKSGSGKELNDEEAVKILMNQAKKRKDAIDMYKQANRTELAEKEEFELKVIEEFLPKQADRSEIEAVVNEVISSTGASSKQDIGKVMGPVMQKLKGKADGKVIKEIVESKLG
jgi:uncharacterized protein YqeY